MNWNFLKKEIEPSDFLIDCRSQTAYEEATLVGAYYYPFIKKAFGSDAESQKKLFSPIRSILDQVSAENKSSIVVFDEGMGMFSARMVHLLRCAGFKESFILGKKWPVDGDTEKGQKILEPEPLDKPKPLNNVVDKNFMKENLTRLQIFDTRTKDEYDGKLPRLTSPEPGTLCGRLPGAFLWDWQTLYDSEGFLIDRQAFTRRLQGFPFMPERPTVLYDYNGARSCLAAMMLIEVGYQDVKTYQGSWFEWRKSSLPKQAASIFGQTSASQAAPRVGGVDRKS